MDFFEKMFLRVVVGEFEKLPEKDKVAGFTEQHLARVLAKELGIDPSMVDTGDFHGSEARLKVLNTADGLEEEGFVRCGGVLGQRRVHPTPSGKDQVKQWDDEENSPAFQGKRIVQFFYDLQRDVPLTHRQAGVAGQVNLEDLYKALGIELEMYKQGADWARRRGFIAEPTVDQFTIENGGAYITDLGKDASEEGFKSEERSAGQTINIRDSQVFGNVVAAGRDAMVIRSAALAQDADEIRTMLEGIQRIAVSLPEDSDDRHDALTELTTVQREFSKDAPSPGRIERSLNAIGSLASMGTLVGPQIARLFELAQQVAG